MTFEERLSLFCENLRLYLKSVEWLKVSIERCKSLDPKAEWSLEDYERIETLFSRFSRAVDILLNKVLRSLDILELEEPLRKLDVVNRAEKRGIVEDYNILIELKDLRNELAREYIEEALKNRLEEVMEKSLLLLEITKNLKEYAQRMEYLEGCPEMGN